MAKPIAVTPVFKNEDAIQVLEEMLKTPTKELETRELFYLRGKIEFHTMNFAKQIQKRF